MIYCDKCKSNKIKIIEVRKNLNGKNLYITYLECEKCKHKYLICVQDKNLIGMRDKINNLKENYNKRISFLKTQSGAFEDKSLKPLLKQIISLENKYKKDLDVCFFKYKNFLTEYGIEKEN